MLATPYHPLNHNYRNLLLRTHQLASAACHRQQRRNSSYTTTTTSLLLSASHPRPTSQLSCSTPPHHPHPHPHPRSSTFMAGLPATQVAMTNYHISDYASLSPVERAKRDAAYRAVKDHFDPAFHYVGIGSGSTVVYVVEAIAQLGHAVTGSIIFVPTGFQSRELIVEAGLPLGSIDSVVPTAASQLRMGEGAIKVATGQQDLGLKGERLMLDVVFDGADEVDDDLNCIKGGGACLFQEKLVATSARKFVCVADYRKYQGRLLKKWPTIPIEIVPTAAPVVVRNLRLMGSPRPFLRLGGSAKAGPIVTDNGNFIVDAPFAPLLTRHDAEKQGGITEADAGKDGVWQVETLARRIKDLVGVVEVGLFTGKNGVDAALAGEIGGGQKPVAAYFGMEGGAVKILTPEGLADAK